MEVVQDNLKSIRSKAETLKQVVIGDESWVYGYDPETKFQSSVIAKRHDFPLVRSTSDE